MNIIKIKDDCKVNASVFGIYFNVDGDKTAKDIKVDAGGEKRFYPSDKKTSYRAFYVDGAWWYDADIKDRHYLKKGDSVQGYASLEITEREDGQWITVNEYDDIETEYNDEMYPVFFDEYVKKYYIDLN